MARWNIACVCVAALAGGCAAPLPVPEQQTSSPIPAEASQMRMEGMVLRLYDEEPGTADAAKPSFWVRAENSTLVEEGVWAFQGAQAVIYDRQGGETVLSAAQGQVDQRTGSETAVLQDGVTLRAGTMTVDLAELTWNNASRVAESNHPVSIASEESNLSASSLQFYPDDERLVLTDVKGTLDLKGEQIP